MRAPERAADRIPPEAQLARIARRRRARARLNRCIGGVLVMLLVPYAFDLDHWKAWPLLSLAYIVTLGRTARHIVSGYVVAAALVLPLMLPMLASARAGAFAEYGLHAGYHLTWPPALVNLMADLHAGGRRA